MDRLAKLAIFLAKVGNFIFEFRLETVRYGRNRCDFMAKLAILAKGAVAAKFAIKKLFVDSQQFTVQIRKQGQNSHP